MSYHNTYNKYKDYAELFTKNIDFSKANINNVLFIEIGDEEAIAEIIENANLKNAEFWLKEEDTIFNVLHLLYGEKVHKFLEYDNNMQFDLIIANPPYDKGNLIISEAITYLTDTGLAAVLMPLSCYKKCDLYKHVETFELANKKLFDADTQPNLGIAILSKNICNKFEYHGLILKNNPMLLAYEYSISKQKKYYMKPMYKVPMAKLDRNIDFIDTSLIYNANKGGGYFAKGGCGYAWNTFNDMSSKKWINKLGVIHFDTKAAKDNFCKYAYNYNDNKHSCLASLLISNVYIAEASEEYYYSIPQIDWSNIHNSQKELWDNGLYDEAVLAEMNLKWNEDKTRIVKA